MGADPRKMSCRQLVWVGAAVGLILVFCGQSSGVFTAISPYNSTTVTQQSLQQSLLRQCRNCIKTEFPSTQLFRRRRARATRRGCPVCNSCDLRFCTARPRCPVKRKPECCYHPVCKGRFGCRWAKFVG